MTNNLEIDLSRIRPKIGNYVRQNWTGRQKYPEESKGQKRQRKREGRDKCTGVDVSGPAWTHAHVNTVQ